MDDKGKKQVPLRISQSLWNDLSAWASDDFRSLNGQIEYLLYECVKKRKKSVIGYYNANAGSGGDNGSGGDGGDNGSGGDGGDGGSYEK